MNEKQAEMIASIREQLQILERWNPGIKRVVPARHSGKLQKVLIANRGEIAKRFFLSLKEEGIRSVAVVTDPDKGQTWYELADEVVMIGASLNYTHIPSIIAAALLTGANAIYPGYGFLSENPDFVEAIHLISDEGGEQPIIFMGPDSTIMRRVGNKLDARKLAKEYGVPLFEGTENISDTEHAKLEASRIGYPVIVKLNAGGGGKGMQAVFEEGELAGAIESCQRIGKMLYQDDTYYLEKFIVKPVHIEVQIFNGTAVGIRKCAVQRRNQKIVEESGDHFLSNHTRLALLAAAENMGRISGYEKDGAAGTVEFLYDPDSDSMGFLEMNTRLQVEHPVTDQSLGIDLARWQILLFDGREEKIPYTRVLEKRFIHKDHTIECRIYAEDPENNYTPSPGKIEELDLPTFNGIRCDFGFRRGDRILPDYDPMIGKLIATAETREEALLRMERALNELYVRGITTNQYQLLRILRSAEFRQGDYTNRLLEEHPDLSQPLKDDELIRQAAILGALSENIKLFRERRDELFFSKDLEAVLHRLDLITLPESYEIEIQGRTYEARFLQTGLNTFYAYLNHIYQGEIELLPALSGENDYTFRFEYRSCPVRVDRRPSVQIIRFPDAGGRIHFMKVKVSARGTTAGRDPSGMVRSPIQGTFVKIHQNNGKAVHRGYRVKKGDPVIVLSAMKMETTIAAPADGMISYLIEDGDLARLELGRTGDGRVVGRPITEGEVLFVIETGEEQKSASVTSLTNSIPEAPLPAGVSDGYRHLFSERFLEEAIKNPDEYLPVVLDLCRLLYLGYNRESLDLIQSVVEVLKELPDNYDLSRMVPESRFVDLLNVFTDSKRLFSPLAGGNVSYFRETYRLFARWGDVSYQLPTPFKYTIQSIFQSYGVQDWRSTAEYERSLTGTAFLYILRSFHSTRDVPDIMKHVLKHAGQFRRPSSRLKNLLRKLVVQEEAEQEHTLAALATETLGRLGVRSWNMEMTYWVSRRYLPDLRKMKNDPLSFSHIDHQTLRSNIEASLGKPSDDLMPSGVKGLVREELKAKLEALQQKGSIRRLYSPKEKILMYLVGDDEPTQRYFTFGLVDEVVPMLDKDNRITGSESVERTDIDAVRVLHAYQSIRYLRGNIVDLIIADESVGLDLSASDPDVYSYQVMMNIVVRLIPFFNDPGIENNIMSIRAKSPHTGKTVRKRIFATPKQGRIILNLLADNDPRNPYNTSALDPKTEHLFRLGKWPAELWIDECFDPGTAREILLTSIDGPSDKRVAVGSRIYSGMIRKQGAVFYFKDSRIAGGATGDLEGRKYVAACWLAIARGWPLYVWNDGAGANIKQGMVSLNRAGEGFFMNALMGSHMTPADIYREISRHDDPIVKQVVDEINEVEKLDAINQPPRSQAFAVAVGVGSSTGLDVYGSSQAAIQVMVDDEQSYRVLTGSAVIKSVTGEDLTNYEIGGARIMNRVTGTVDRVARSNLHLLTVIHELQELFTGAEDLPAIRRVPVVGNLIGRDADDVLTPHIIRTNLDNGIFVQFKEEYYGGGALTGGFGRMAGRPVLVLGPRSNMGLRSFQSMVRAAELLIEAKKLKADQIVVIGDEWFSETPRTDAATLRARQDVLKLMSSKAGLRIHIATSVGALRKIMLHSFCDALIFVRSEDYSEREEDLIRNGATHVVNSLEEAFDLSVHIMQLLRPIGEPTVRTSKKKPSLPAESTQPFDIIESVLSPAFDENSFIEWYGPMNDPKRGPCLVTGFATLDGESVAIIADQPSIMGGAPDAPGTEKFRIFTELVERNGLPIVMISNAPGFVPGTRQERLRIQQIGGRSLDVNVLSTVPIVSVVLQQNYGGRQIHAFSKYLRPGTVSLALKSSILAVMGGSSAFDLFQGKKYAELREGGKDSDAEALRKSFVDDFNTKARAENDALGTGVLDLVIDSVKELRSALIDSLSLSRKRN